MNKNKSLVMVVCKKQSKGASPVKYEIFDFYAKIAESLGQEEWKIFFQNLSRGNNNQGIKFNGRIVSIGKGNSIHTYDVVIPEVMEMDELKKEDVENFEQCKNFFSKYHFAKDENNAENSNVIVNEPFKDEGLENKFKLGILNQTTYIERFARQQCRKMNLDENICESLISTINSLFASKQLTSKSIMQNKSDGEINYIKGITINRAGFFIDPSQLYTSKVQESSNKKPKDLHFRSSVRLSKIEQKIWKNYR